VRPHPKASLERVELFSFREICQAASLSKFRKMKKAQTAQRTAVLDVFLDRAVLDGERSETIRALEQISKNEKSPDRAADCSFGCVFY